MWQRNNETTCGAGKKLHGEQIVRLSEEDAKACAAVVAVEDAQVSDEVSEVAAELQRIRAEKEKKLAEEEKTNPPFIIGPESSNPVIETLGTWMLNFCNEDNWNYQGNLFVRNFTHERFFRPVESGLAGADPDLSGVENSVAKGAYNVSERGVGVQSSYSVGEILFRVPRKCWLTPEKMDPIYAEFLNRRRIFWRIVEAH